MSVVTFEVLRLDKDLTTRREDIDIEERENILLRYFIFIKGTRKGTGKRGKMVLWLVMQNLNGQGISSPIFVPKNYAY